jgi:hypothetical protein
MCDTRPDSFCDRRLHSITKEDRAWPRPGGGCVGRGAALARPCLDPRAGSGHVESMPVLASVIGLGHLPAVRAPAWAGIALTGALAGWLALAEVLAPAVQAEPLTLEGLTFSDELGGVEIMQGWGSGTLDDPFVLVEEITEDEPAILVVRGMSHRFGNRIRSHHEVGFALTKIVHNRTEQAWSQFDLELRELVDYPSPFGDGLSFGQASEVGRPFFADRFVDSIETREPYDSISFFDGSVEPGETVVVKVMITDTTPRYEFFLLQKRDSPLALTPGLPADERPATALPALISTRIAAPGAAVTQEAAIAVGE